MLQAAARRLQQILLGPASRPLRPLAALVYRIVIWAVVAFVRRGGEGAVAVYLRGSWARGEAVPGLSDIDLAAVAPDGAGESFRRRWRTLLARVSPLGSLVQLAVYEDSELRVAAGESTLTARSAVHLGPDLPRDDAAVRVRPGLFGPFAEWRRLRGPDRLPVVPLADRQGRRLAAWLELQAVWRDAFRACAGPEAMGLPQLCVKLVADPARIWLGLVEGVAVSRRDALASAVDEAASRYDELAPGRHPPLEDALEALLKQSDRLARWLIADVADEPRTEVRLLGAEPAELAFAPDADGPLRRLMGAEPRLLPLADWHAIVWPFHPDDAFAPADFDPADPAILGAAIRAAGSWGPYPALRYGELTILPGPGMLRAVACRLIDPVSFAIAAGGSVAVFPELAGWSARDWARRAVVEHRAWLGVADRSERHIRPAVPLLDDWMQALSRTSSPDHVVIGLLLSAARAALFQESLADGRPELAVTVSAAASELDRRLGDIGGLAAEAAATYRACRLSATDPPLTLVMNLREAVLRLPAFAATAAST